ncbi:hypothetical protein [Streptomyces sp. LN785]|uniref:hypothetical protein n=1 Tax=Streptomyces sp. LN785 TaxID=3112983 RepID=UPI0037175D07
MSQRAGDTDWAQASLYVPLSSSRPNIGPATNMPMRAGRSSITRLAYLSRRLKMSSLLRTWRTATPQPLTVCSTEQPVPANVSETELIHR